MTKMVAHMWGIRKANLGLASLSVSMRARYKICYFDFCLEIFPKEISYLLIINFEIWRPYKKFRIIYYGKRFKNVLESAGNDPSLESGLDILQRKIFNFFIWYKNAAS